MTAYWRLIAGLILTATIGVLTGCGEKKGEAPQLKWAMSDESGGAFEQAAQYCSEASQGRYRVKLNPLPADGRKRHEQLSSSLKDNNQDLDIVGINAAWTAEFADAGWILPWPEQLARPLRAIRLRSTVESATYQRQLWAVPFTTDAQLLWFRADRIAIPPTNWRTLIVETQRQAGHGAIQVRADKGEDLATFFVSLLASAGGTVLGDAGSLVSLSEIPTRRALAVMRRLGNSPAADPALIEGRDNDARHAFESGKAVFLIDDIGAWSSARANAPDIAAHMGWARWPSVIEGRPSQVTVGGVNLAVSAHGRHPELAFEAADCLASAASQRAAAIQGTMAPTIAALYDDDEVRAALPFADLLRVQLDHAVQMPQTPRYFSLVHAISSTLNPMREIQPGRDAGRLHERVREVLREDEPQ